MDPAWWLQSCTHLGVMLIIMYTSGFGDSGHIYPLGWGNRKGRTPRSTDRALSQWNVSLKRSFLTANHIQPQIIFDPGYKWSPAGDTIWLGPLGSSGFAVRDSPLGLGCRPRKLLKDWVPLSSWWVIIYSGLSLSALAWWVSNCTLWVTPENPRLAGEWLCIVGCPWESSWSECTFWIPVCSCVVIRTQLSLWVA